jgi:hypothetical protein
MVPDNITAKMLDVKITATKASITLKGVPGPIFEGEWNKKIKADETLWTVEKEGTKKILQLVLDKFEGMSWWDCVLKGDPKIDTQKVEPENSKLSDLDGETRMTVEKMMYD